MEMQPISALASTASVAGKAPAPAPAEPWPKTGWGADGKGFAGGTAYPPPVIVDLRDAFMRPGETTAQVLVELSGKSANTVVAHVRCLNGSGAFVERDHEQAVIFRPGDPLRRTVGCAVRSTETGDTIRFTQSQVPDGAKRGRTNAAVMVSPTAPAMLPLDQGFRDPHTFAPLGKLVYEADGATIRFDDSGGPDTWSTGLSHGRTQTGNAETGYYATQAMGVFERRGRDLVFKTRRAEQPVHDRKTGNDYPFLAAALSAHKTSDLHFRYGSMEWEARMPDRRGSWPALWFVSTKGWPPEIDVYEGFGYSSDWRFASDLSTNLHGGKSLKRTFTRLAQNMQMSDFGLPNTLTSEFHKFQVTVDEDWITMFVDGIETMRYANPFAGHRWFPIMNVAVKADRESDYDDGSGEMVVRSVKLWRED